MDAPPTNTNDFVLVARLRDGDERALREIWDQYHIRLAEFSLRYVGSSDAAADVVQQLFIALWNQRERLVPTVNLTGYLHAMARNLSIKAAEHDRVVRRHTERMLAEQQAVSIVASNTGLALVEVQDSQRILRRALETLPPRTREIFLMSREDGLAPAEIATALGIAPQVVYNQLSRALKVLVQAVADS